MFLNVIYNFVFITLLRVNIYITLNRYFEFYISYFIFFIVETLHNKTERLLEVGLYWNSNRGNNTIKQPPKWNYQMQLIECLKANKTT